VTCSTVVLHKVNIHRNLRARLVTTHLPRDSVRHRKTPRDLTNYLKTFNFMDFFASSNVLKLIKLIQHYVAGPGGASVFRVASKTYWYYRTAYLLPCLFCLLTYFLAYFTYLLNKLLI